MKQVQLIIIFNIVLMLKESYGYRRKHNDGWVFTNPQWEQPNTNEGGNNHDIQIGNGFSTQYLDRDQRYKNREYPNESNANSNDANERLNGQYNPQMWGSQATNNNYNKQQYEPIDYPVATPSVQRPQNNFNVGNAGERSSVAATVGNFGVKMLQVANQRNNIVMSPYSVTTLLALLQQGSSGATQQQLSSALQMSNEDAASGFRQLTNNLKVRRSRGNTLNIANNVFLAADFSLNQNFAQKARNNFNSEITPLNFGYSSKAVQTINEWVSRATNHNINQLVSPSSVNGNTQLVLVNALHFKGLWQMKFRAESTQQREFYANGGQRKPADFMRARKKYRYGEDGSSQILVLPFQDSEYTLTIVLPSQKTSIDQIIQNLSYDKMAEYQGFSIQDVDIEIPKFSIRSDTDLRPVLMQMGITNMFGGASELYGIVNQGYNPPQVSSAIHSAMLSIDEEGGTASAATAFTVVALSYSVPDAVFKADRPFLAILWDTKLSLLLIMAKIEDPTL